MDSLKSFERRKPSAGKLHAPRLADLIRFRGHRGGVIPMHRALTRFILGPLDLITSVLLVLLLSLVWLVSLPWACRFWQRVLATGVRVLDPRAELGLAEHRLTSYIRFVIPYPRMEALLPNAQTWWLTAAVILALLAASFLLPKKLTPVTYLLRGVLFIQATALLYFFWAAARFPHTPDSYLEGLMSYGIALISAIPLLFGLTYYIFNFGLAKKALLTAMTMIHLSLFLPLQILLQALILQRSVLFMPVLYIIFGLPVDVLIIIAFYSWGMSWSSGTQ